MPRKPRSIQARGQQNAPDFVPAGDVAGGPLFLNILGHWQDDVPPWNAIYPNWRDRLLKRFVYTETGLSSAVQTVKLKMQTLNYQLNGPERTKRKVQTLLEAPGFTGESFSDITGKLVDDLLTSDNGAFLELWKPGDPSRDAGKAPCVGFAQLDSRQCFRSFDQEFPVWYTNPFTGEQRKIHRSRVIFTSLNTQPQELARGIGFSPTSTVLRWSRLMRSALIYSDEKISGGFTRAIGAIKGVTKKQVEDVEANTQTQKERKGWTVYSGIPFLISPGAEPGQDIDIILKDLASIPDGFDLHQIQQLYAYVLAFAFGVDAREFWPSTQSGATKADAAIQNMKAQGKMPGFLIQTLEYFWRQAIPESVSFEYDYTDDEADKQRHEIYQMRTSTLQSYVISGAITPQQMLVQAIADGILDPEVLAGAEMPVTSDDQFTEADETVSSGDPTDAPPMPEDMSVEGKAAARKSINTYRDNLRYAVRALYGGSFTFYEFLTTFQRSIDYFFTEAWQAGAALCGMMPADMTEEERTRLRLEINTEYTFVSNFGSAIISAAQAESGLETLFARVDLWVNNYSRVFTTGQLMACADKKGKWEMGAREEHCDDCLGYHGRVYRNSVWQKFLEPYDAMPQGHGLACGGWQCGCAISPTTDPVTPGFPPRPIGGFKAHAHHGKSQPETDPAEKHAEYERVPAGN